MAWPTDYTQIELIWTDAHMGCALPFQVQEPMHRNGSRDSSRDAGGSQLLNERLWVHLEGRTSEFSAPQHHKLSDIHSSSALDLLDVSMTTGRLLVVTCIQAAPSINSRSWTAAGMHSLTH